MNETPRPVDLLVTHAEIYTMDDDATVWGDGALAVLGDTIVALGKNDDVVAAHRAARTIDAAGQLLLPGLIDTHIHPVIALTRQPRIRPPGAAPYDGPATLREDRKFGEISTSGHEPLGANMVPFTAGIHQLAGVPEPLAYVLSLYSLLLAVRHGVTAFVDGGGGSVDAIAQAAIDIGVRAGVGTMAFDLAVEGDSSSISTRRCRDTDEVLAEAEAAVNRWHGAEGGRVSAWVDPIMDVTASDELLSGLAEISDRHQIGFVTHTASAYSQQVMSETLHGRRGVQRMHECGALSPRWLGIHMGFTNDDERALLGPAGARIGHCPVTSAQAGKGIFVDRQVFKMMEEGVTVGLGTDTISMGSMLDQIKLAQQGHKEALRDDRVVPPYFALAMATREAAACALQAERIGSLTSGRQADFILVKRDRPEYIGADPIAAFCRYGQQSDIRSVFSGGRCLIDDGELRSMDEDWIVREMHGAMAAIAAFQGD